MPAPRRSVRLSGTNQQATTSSQLAPPPPPISKERDVFDQGSPQRPRKSFLPTDVPTARLTRSATARATPLKAKPSGTRSSKKASVKIFVEGKVGNAQWKASKRRRSEKEEGFLEGGDDAGTGTEDTLSGPVLRADEDGERLPKKHKAKGPVGQDLDDGVPLGPLWSWGTDATWGPCKKSARETSTHSTGSEGSGDEVERMLSLVGSGSVTKLESTFEDEAPQKPTVKTPTIEDKVPAVVEADSGDESVGIELEGDKVASQDDSSNQPAAKVVESAASEDRHDEEHSSTGDTPAVVVVEPTSRQETSEDKVTTSNTPLAQPMARNLPIEVVVPRRIKKAAPSPKVSTRTFLVPRRSVPVNVQNIASSSTRRPTPRVPANKTVIENKMAVQDKLPMLDQNLDKVFEEVIDMDQLADGTLSKEYWGIERKVVKEKPAMFPGYPQHYGYFPILVPVYYLPLI